MIREEKKFGYLHITKVEIPQRHGDNELAFDVYIENQRGAGVLLVSLGTEEEAFNAIRALVGDSIDASFFVQGVPKS